MEEVTTRLFDTDTPLRQIEGYLATECRDDFDSGAVIFARDLIGDAEVTVEVTSIEFIADDRALVESRLLVDGEPSALLGGDEDDESSLWVLQDGQWYGADDCEFFGTEEE